MSNDTQTREVTTPTADIRHALAAVARVEADDSEIVAAEVRDGELVVELRGAPLGGSE